MMNKVSEAKAELVRKRINASFNPVFEGERFYSEPTLRMDWEGHHVAILWEDGPSDWAFNLDGSPSEEDRVLVAQANVEFGGNMKASNRKPVVLPKGVEAEPFYSFVLVLYPA